MTRSLANFQGSYTHIRFATVQPINQDLHGSQLWNASHSPKGVKPAHNKILACLGTSYLATNRLLVCSIFGVLELESENMHIKFCQKPMYPPPVQAKWTTEIVKPEKQAGERRSQQQKW